MPVLEKNVLQQSLIYNHSPQAWICLPGPSEQLVSKSICFLPWLHMTAFCSTLRKWLHFMHTIHIFVINQQKKCIVQTRHNLTILVINIQADKKGFNLIFSSSYPKSVGSPSQFLLVWNAVPFSSFSKQTPKFLQKPALKFFLALTNTNYSFSFLGLDDK